MKIFAEIMRSSLVRRVMAGAGANAYGQAANILIQLASLPIFLSKWDLRTYGIWLTLSAIPSYFSMADAGMVTVAANKMTMAVAAGENQLANRVFKSAQLFVALTCTALIVFGGAILFMAISQPSDVLNFQLIVGSLILVVLLTMSGGLANAVYRATGRYALGTSLDTSARLMEWSGGLIGLFVGGNFLSVAVGMLLSRIVAFAFITFNSTKNSNIFSWGVIGAEFSIIRAMLRPSLGFMTFPISNALNFQGFTLLTAHFLGPVAVAIFNTYRTVARVTVQITSILSHSLWPEFSRMYGKAEYQKLWKLLIKTSIGGALGSILICAIVYFLSPYFIEYWTKGKVDFLPSLMASFVFYSIVASSWHIPRVALMATNQHSVLGVAFLAISVLTIIFGWALVRMLGIQGLALALTFGEAAGLALCLYLALKKFRRLAS